jgi:hypothetical protein
MRWNPSEGLRRFKRSGLLLVSISVVVIGMASYINELRLPALGFHWRSGDVVYVVRRGGPAERAGVQKGDVFRNLDGVEPSKRADFERKLRGTKIGEEVSLVVEREDEEVSLTLVPSKKPLSLEGWIVDYIVAFVCWAAGLFVYRQRRGDRVALFYLSFSLVSALILFTLLPSQRWFRVLQYLGLGFAPGIFSHFFLAFAEELVCRASDSKGEGRFPRPSPLALILLYFPGVSLGLLNSFLLILQVERALAWAYDLLSLNFVLGFVIWLILFFACLRSSPPQAKSELKEMALGTTIAASPFIFLLVIDVFTKSQLLDPRFMHFSAIGFPLALSYALLKGHMEELDRFVNLGLVYTLLVGVIFALYLLLVKSFSALFEVVISWDGLLIGSFSAIILAFLFPPIKKKIQSIVNRIFY